MKDFVEKRDLDEERLKPGKVAKLLREIINATRKWGADNDYLFIGGRIRGIFGPLGDGKNRQVTFSAPVQPLDVIDAEAFSLQAISDN